MPDELTILAHETGAEARSYLVAVREVASGSEPESAIPLLLLAISQVLVTGARLGAITDVVPEDRFEADPGPDDDIDPLRQGLANLFEGIDEYADLVDPVTSLEMTKGALSNDIADVAAALSHGLRHLQGGRTVEPYLFPGRIEGEVCAGGVVHGSVGGNDTPVDLDVTSDKRGFGPGDAGGKVVKLTRPTSDL